MKLRSLMISVAVVCLHLFSEPGIAGPPESAYRVFRVSGVCLPCGGESYVVIDSRERIETLYSAAKERCRASAAPDTWRQTILDLKIDFRNEAIVTMYEVIGTGGKPSLRISGPERGVLEAAISWDTGPPPHVPIATAACLSFAVQKNAVKRISVTSGGVLNKSREKLPLPVLTTGRNKAAAADTPPR